MPYSLEIQKSHRRTIALSVEKDLHILVKAPLFMSRQQIEAFVQKHESWIEEHLRLQKERQENARTFTPQEQEALAAKARKIAEEGFQKYVPLMHVTPAGLKITSAVTRWGSCSGKNSICFSYRIALLPQEAADYIIVHELAHILQKNHGPHFYAEVAKALPDYKQRISILKQAAQKLGL